MLLLFCAYYKASTESLIWILFSEMAAEHIQNMITKYNKREDLCLAQAISSKSMEHNERRQWTARANYIERYISQIRNPMTQFDSMGFTILYYATAMETLRVKEARVNNKVDWGAYNAHTTYITYGMALDEGTWCWK